MRTSERQLFRARFAWLCNWLPSDVYDGGHFTVTVVCLPAKSKKKKEKKTKKMKKRKKTPFKRGFYQR